ncbi:MAG: glycosyl hydrolase family 18 protein, partial [Bacteroidota bacterium]
MRLSVLTCGLLFILLIINSCKKETPPPNPTPTPNPVPSCINNSTPAAASVVNAGATVTLSWTAATNATSYDVYLGTMATPTATVATNVSGTSFSYTVPTTANALYYWYVLPKNSAGAATGCTGSVTSFTAVSIQTPAPFGFYVVGYFPSYRSLADIPDVKFRMCNVVNYAFFGVNAGGTLTVNNPTLVPQFVTKAKANNAKVFMSINDGTGDGKTNFKSMAATAAGRNVFIKDVMAKVTQYGFDGVDVDWEFPTTSDGTDVTFTALMKELSDSLHRDAKYYLTAAITAGKYAGGIRDAIKAEVFGYADFLNVMAYDDFNTTIPYKHHSDLALAQTCINYWRKTRGMPREKLVLGFPAYGRPSGITQSGTILAYKDVLAKGGSPLSDSAIVTNGSFTNYTIYYNGQPTVKIKTKLAQAQGNGVMMWEKWHDAMDGNSLLKAACDTIGRG